MVTDDLVQRGLDFDSAYAIARAIRDRLESREEMTTGEIRDLMRDELQARFGGELPAGLREPVKWAPALKVVYHGQQQPFSRGLLAQSIYAAGLALDRAYRLVGQLEKELHRDGIAVIQSHEVARRVGDPDDEERSRRFLPRRQ